MKKNPMHKYLVWASLLPALLWSQSNDFTFIQHDTAYVGSEEYIIQYGDIISLIDENQDLTVTRVTHTIPDTWYCAFCVGSACLPDFLDQYSFTLEANDTSEFSLDTTPYGEAGFGSWTIFAENITTGEIDSVHITLEYVVVGVKGSNVVPDGFELSSAYPNPTNAWINFDFNVPEAGLYSLELISLDGRQAAARSYDLRQGPNSLQWSLIGIPSGSYILTARNAGRTLSQKVSIIK